VRSRRAPTALVTYRQLVFGFFVVGISAVMWMTGYAEANIWLDGTHRFLF
jgi:hypothetical protein